MSATVRSTCPGCQRELRIPAGWLQQTMRCKHCGQMVRAKAPPPGEADATLPPAPVARPAAPPAAAGPGAAPASAPFGFAAPAPPPSGDPFALHPDDDQPARRRRRRRDYTPLAVLMLFVALAGGAALAAYAYRDKLFATAGGPK